jgi:hypothetical protein
MILVRPIPLKSSQSNKRKRNGKKDPKAGEIEIVSSNLTIQLCSSICHLTSSICNLLLLSHWLLRVCNLSHSGDNLLCRIDCWLWPALEQLENLPTLVNDEDASLGLLGWLVLETNGADEGVAWIADEVIGEALFGLEGCVRLWAVRGETVYREAATR